MKWQASPTEFSGHFEGESFRLSWSQYQWQLEELPAKGKRMLRRATFSSPCSNDAFRFSDKGYLFLIDNLFTAAEIDSSLTYDKVKDRVTRAYSEAVAAYGHAPSWVADSKWYEEKVNSLKIEPKGCLPITVKGQDFCLQISWTTFRVYSPDSDFQQSDPYFTGMVQKSAASARKLYKKLQAEPNALEGVTYDDLSKWFESQGISYSHIFSTWG